MNICLLIILALIVNISSSLNCVGSPHALPCQCSLSKYGCSTNTNDCTWSFSKCISSSSLIKPDKDKTMQGDQEPSIQSSPPDPITIPSSTLVPLANIFPTFGEPITNITCGDQVENFWMQMPITFILTISTDIPSIIIDGCLSNFDTTLRLFGPDDLHTPIAADDDGCFDSSTGASIIDYKPSNGEIIRAGIYMLDLSSNVIRDEGIYNLDIQCGTFPPSKSPTPKPSRSPTSDDDQNESDSKPSKDDSSSESISISDSDEQEWWMPTPRPTKGIFNDPTECTRNCDAFRIKLLYYGKISDYNTDTIYYDTIETDNDDRRRRMQSSILNRGDSDDDDGNIINADASCYTYQVERLFDDGICSEKVEQIVLGACSSDYNRVNHQDLDKLILREYGGDIYNGFSSFGKTEITGIQVDIKVDDDPVEFTLCMNGINDEGYTSDFVKFNRKDIKGYLCNNAGNDGLPCLKDEYRNNKYQVQSDLFGAANNDLGGEEMHIITDMQHDSDNIKQEPSDTISNVLIVVLLLVITIMVFVAIFYLCVSREKSWLHSAVQKWTMDVTSINWTATEDDIIGESSPFAGYDGNNSNAECDGISLSSSLEFDENEHEIELCGINNHHHRYNNNNLDEESRKLSAGSSSDKTISSLEKEPTHENKHYYKLSMDKSYRYRNKSSINLSGTSLLNMSNSPFSDDKIGILKEQMYEEIIEEASDDESEHKESSASPTITTSSSDVIFKDSTTQSSEDNNNNGNASSSSPTATNTSAATASPPARGNEHRDVERIIEKVFAKQVISPALISMNMDNMSMISGSTSIDENDGTTILSVYDEYNNKSTTHQSQIYTISESKSVSENDDDDDDNNHNKVGKIGKSSTNNPNNSLLLKEHEHEQTDLTANVINAVRYNGASAYYE